MIRLLLFCAPWTLGLVLVAWLVYRATRNAGWIDAAWGLGLGGVAVIAALAGEGSPQVRLLVGLLGGFWGLRLGLHIAHRVLHEAEDGRYARLREEWGEKAELKLFRFFLFQGVLQLLIGLPFLLAVGRSGGAWVLIGAMVAGLGLLGEAVADDQLRRFKADPSTHGQVCRRGLWAFSRHPNYFFEWSIWVGFALMAQPTQPWGWLAFLSPALLLHFLLKVTGIPATEAQALRSRGEAYAAYQREVSAFIPWFPKGRS